MPALNLKKTYQKYPEYKDSKSDWVGVIPKNWNIKRNRFLSTYIKGKNVDFCNPSEKGCLPYLTAEVIRGTAEPEYCFGDVIAKENQLLLLWDGANAGEFFLAGPGVVSSTFSLITSNKEINPRFYYWVSKSFEKKLRDYTQGMGIPHVSPSIFKDSYFPEIPTIEQKRISDFLDSKTNLTNQIIEKKQKLIGLLQEKRSALITHAVTKGLDPTAKMKPSGIELIGEIPENWTANRIKNLISYYSRGGTPDYSDEKTDFRFINQSCIRSGYFDLKKIKYSLKAPSKGKIRSGDILINSTGTGTLGRSSVFTEKDIYYADTHVTIIRPKKINSKYLSLMIEIDRWQDYIYATAVTGSTNQIELSPTKLVEIPIITPNLTEQDKIVQYITEKSIKIDDSILLINSQLEKIKEYRSSLIYHAVTGKIKV